MARTREHVVGLAAVVAGIISLSATPAAAAPIAFGSNYYEFVQVVFSPFTQADYDLNTFALASAAASSTTFGGVNGQVAEVGSAVENDFLLSLTSSLGFRTFAGAWIVPDAGFANFGGIEPNNGGGFVFMNLGPVVSGIGTGQWADDSGVLGTPDPLNDPVVGYFIEWENPQVTNPVPEPATLLLTAIGLAGAATRLRRPRRADRRLRSAIGR